MGLGRTLRGALGRLRARMSRRYYFEDYVRVYPDGLVFDRSGKQREPTENDRRNLLNHMKFYRFAAQFVSGKTAADLGCGSGHGCRVLKDTGAARVLAADASEAAVAFARSHYADCAEFSVQSVTDLAAYADNSVDVSVSSEVLEHVKEYGWDKTEQAVAEMRRITRPGGLLVVETPNSEMLADHGFSFDEITALFPQGADRFSDALVFENALVPFGDRRGLWERRLAEGKVATVVSADINLAETVLPTGIETADGSGDAAPASCLRIENRPNPFNPATTIRFRIPEAGRAVLTVHDLAGRRVATLVSDSFEAGSFTATWDGRDEAGREAGSGIYFARLRTGGFTAMRKMVLIR